MSRIVTVREYARLTVSDVKPTLDRAKISEEDFDWLAEFSAYTRKGGAELVHVEDRRWLRLDNFVGVIETPAGTTIEILPKHVAAGEDIAAHRALLLKMIRRVTDVDPREAAEADLQVLNLPLPEWLISRFLANLESLVKKGLRFDYTEVQEESRFLRGRLDFPRQLRQPPGRQHLFHIHHEIFVPDGPENRLLKSALRVARDAARTTRNWRLARELWQYLEPIPQSMAVDQDFARWRTDRLMAHYRGIRPWCEMILRGNVPIAQLGEQRGISLLFPMEELFEKFVATCLRKQLSVPHRLTTQARRHSLCTHLGKPIFQLRPDLLIERSRKPVAVLDTKWKRLATHKDKYGLGQSDFYQLFAYGEKYLAGSGDLFLVYPARPGFTDPLPPFDFTDELRLWVVPFDLELELLVPGDWAEHADWATTAVLRNAETAA